jgi:hypothetical protein
MTGAVASVFGALAALVVAASPAEAICRDQGDGVSITFNYNGHAVAEERQIAGTCNGDRVYEGQIRDRYADGYSAKVRYQDEEFEAVLASSSGDWKNYSFTDKSTDGSASYAGVQIYSNPEIRPIFWWVNKGY